ncbi:elastase-1-like isoform X2 [Clytia hemisphaerica]|uniref:elastase-1-like isoform X2 n=1 Tax=Clytia hemisphaerica TaxID=252671 RepID=UPI0034D5ABB6
MKEQISNGRSTVFYNDNQYNQFYSSRQRDKRSMAVGSLEENLCRDIASWCSEYIIYCSYPYVSNNCQKTCQVCKDYADGCEDKAEWCPGYKAYCKDVPYIQENCPKSCEKCPQVGTGEPTTCRDRSSRCSSYSHICYQDKYLNFMKTNCENTCRFCEGDCGIAEQRKLASASSVVQGESAPVGYYPWQAGIYFDGDFLCGGTLIDRTHLLSAAHCFYVLDRDDLTKYKVVLGDNNKDVNEGMEQRITISNMTLHENYETQTYKNDIAILELSIPAELNNFVNTICLPDYSVELPVGKKCFVTGWGKTSVISYTSNLLQAELPVVDTETCATRNSFNNHVVTTDMLCAGYNNGFTYASACHGDSGGPFQCEDPDSKKWFLYGVVSWGSPQCNGLDSYTVFTKVSKYISWIYKNKT